MPVKDRLDNLMVARGLAADRDLALRLVMAGQVRVHGQVVLQPSARVAPDAEIAVDPGPRFVSRGGEKLEAALQTFALSPSGRVCADIGASTGGFTDCLLQSGAQRVFAIDVGQGILAWKLRQDERVVVMEETNARSVPSLPEPVSLVTIDASFISLKVLLPVIMDWAVPGQTLDVIALVKPQFEADRQAVERGKGVIRDPAVHRQVLVNVLGYAQSAGWSVRGLAASPLLGPKGNREFLVWLRKELIEPESRLPADIQLLVDSVVAG